MKVSIEEKLRGTQPALQEMPGELLQSMTELRQP
jgi:hypothetical protein